MTAPLFYRLGRRPQTAHKIRAFGVVLFSWLSLWLTVGGCGAAGSSGPVIANAGADRDVLRNAVVTLDGTGSAGVQSSKWAFLSKPPGSAATLSGTTTLTPSFIPDVGGDYVIQLSVNGDAEKDSVTVTTKSTSVSIIVPPGSAITTRERFGETEYVVDLGAFGGTLATAASRTAGVSTGTTKEALVTYTWEQVSGPRATPTGGTTAATLTFKAPTLADFLSRSDRYKWQNLRVSRNDTKMTFKLTVTDALGNPASGTISVYLQDDGTEIHTSSGLPNVGLGTRVTLSGPDLNAAGAGATDPGTEEGSAITDWGWTLSSVPPGSSAVFLDSGTNASTSEFPSFVPDVSGLYVVDFNSATGNATAFAIKTVKVPGTLTINAADFIGAGTIGGADPHTRQCATCHNGTNVDGLEDMITKWQGTKHASIFENSMEVYKWLAPEPYLWEFHTVGYNTDANDNGFDDLAGAAGWTFPLSGLTFPEFTSAYPLVARLANVQCENCHGPGEGHTGKKDRIAVSFSQFGTCGSCHVQAEPWMNSGHNSTGVQHGDGAYQSDWPTQDGCPRCHTAKGFEKFIHGETEPADTSDETGAFPGVTCAACHDPHDATNPFQLRLYGDVTLAIDGSTISAGKAAVCYACHDGNNAKGRLDCDTDLNGAADGNTSCAATAQTADEYWGGGYHYGPQGPMLEGKQALTDLNGDGIPEFFTTQNSFHSEPVGFNLAGVTKNSDLPSENNKCVTCHMAQGPSPDEEGYQHLGGHAFKLRTGPGAESVPLVSACQVCHPTITRKTGFNRPAAVDYDGDGTIEGIQDEIRGLLVNLGTLIRSLDTVNIDQTSGFMAGGGTLTENTIRWAGSAESLPDGKDCTTQPPVDGRDNYQPCRFVDVRNGPGHRILPRAVWNYNSVVRDGSLGIHNTAYTIQVLQGTYRALRILMQGAPGTTTYKTDFPSAALR